MPSRRLTPLDYDRQNRTDYVKVLKIYAQTGKNVQITAEKMHLSKASIYRILSGSKRSRSRILNRLSAFLICIFQLFLWTMKRRTRYAQNIYCEDDAVIASAIAAHLKTGDAIHNAPRL